MKPEPTAGAAVCGLATAGVACAAGCKQTPEVAGAASASGMAEMSALAESEACRMDPRHRDERAAWMRFHRSLATGGKRKARAEKCPDHIKEGIAQDPLKHGYYMDLWVSQQESWGAVIAYERRYSLDVTGTKFTEQWLTEGQLLGVYQDKTVVQAHG